MTKDSFNEKAPGQDETPQTRWVFFKPDPNKKTQGMEVPANLTVPEVEEKIAEISETPKGSVAYWLAEPGQDKKTAWQAARAAGIRYLMPEEIEAFRKHLPDMSMNDIMLDITRAEAAVKRDMDKKPG